MGLLHCHHGLTHAPSLFVCGLQEIAKNIQAEAEQKGVKGRVRWAFLGLWFALGAASPRRASSPLSAQPGVAPRSSMEDALPCCDLAV